MFIVFLLNLSIIFFINGENINLKLYGKLAKNIMAILEVDHPFSDSIIGRLTSTLIKTMPAEIEAENIKNRILKLSFINLKNKV